MSAIEAEQDGLAAPAADLGRWSRTATLGAVALIAIGMLLAAALAFSLLQRLPDQITLHAFGHGLTVRSIHDRLIGRMIVVLMILPLALLVELAAVGWSRSSVRALLFARTPSAKTDLAVFALGQAQVLDALGRIMLLGLSLISGLWVRERVRALTGFSIDPGPIPFLLQLPLYFLAYTFFDYWTHRISHMSLFWPLHRYHHSATEFCTLTSDRQHPASFVGLFVINIPLALLGAPAAVMIYVLALTNSFGYLAHSKITSDWGFVGRWILQSPRGHRLHHKLSMDEPTGHYSMVPLWDRLFGTWRGTQSPDLAIGVSKPYRHGYVVAGDMVRDYVDFFRGLIGRPAQL